MAQPQSIAEQLDRVVPDFDRLIADARLGPRSARHLHELEERAQQIAAAIVAPFRGAGARPVNPPIGKIGTATVW